MKSGFYVAVYQVNGNVAGRSADGDGIPMVGGCLAFVERYPPFDQHFVEHSPKFQTFVLRFIQFRVVGKCFQLLGKIVGLFNDIEIWGGFGISDGISMDFNQEEGYIGICMFVQPFDGAFVFLFGFGHNPDDHGGIQSRGVGDDFAQVVIVGGFQLIFNEHILAGDFILADDIAAVTAHILLCLHIGERQVQFLAELFYVIFFRQPARKVALLVGHTSRGSTSVNLPNCMGLILDAVTIVILTFQTIQKPYKCLSMIHPPYQIPLHVVWLSNICYQHTNLPPILCFVRISFLFVI